ncbi:MAG: hypothetical protein QOF48_980, partial [Verrucomicrobiota bacterium]
TEIRSARKNAQAQSTQSAELSPTGNLSTNQVRIIAPRQLPGIVVDSADARQVGAWKHSVFSGQFIGDGYFHDDNNGKGSKTLTFQPELPHPGRYEVRLAYVAAQNRATNIPVTVFHADGESVIHVNQQEAPAIDSRFVSLGTFRFETNGFASALIANDNTRGYVTVDAVQFLPEDSPPASLGKPLSTPETRTSKPRAGSVPVKPAISSDIRLLEDKLKKLKSTGPRRPMTMGVQEADRIQDIPIHLRGSVHNLGAIVPRGFLTFGQPQAQPPLPAHESGRRELANWIVSPLNPLTARVHVNRVWLWLLGQGLVATPDNFGTTGETPSHPELLDYLAAKFIEQGWSNKKLIREIVLSKTYQLGAFPIARSSSEAVSPSHRSESDLRTSPDFGDSENCLLTHAPRRRLTAEELRDAILKVSGQLKLDTAGPTFPPGLTADFGFKFTEPVRSVYVPVFRNALPELFETFDFPPPGMVTGRRSASIVPTQALFLLNHPWVREQAQIAARHAIDDSHDDTTRLDRAYRAALGRLPSDAERSVAVRHFKKAAPSARLEAWTDLFLALFASADFRYLD